MTTKRENILIRMCKSTDEKNGHKNSRKELWREKSDPKIGRKTLVHRIATIRIIIPITGMMTEERAGIEAEVEVEVEVEVERDALIMATTLRGMTAEIEI